MVTSWLAYGHILLTIDLDLAYDEHALHTFLQVMLLHDVLLLSTLRLVPETACCINA